MQFNKRKYIFFIEVHSRLKWKYSSKYCTYSTRANRISLVVFHWLIIRCHPGGLGGKNYKYIFVSTKYWYEIIACVFVSYLPFFFFRLARECIAPGICCCAAVRAITVMVLMRARKRRECDAAAVFCCHFISGSSRKYQQPRCNEPADRITCRAKHRSPRFHPLNRLTKRCCTGGPANALYVTAWGFL